MSAIWLGNAQALCEAPKGLPWVQVQKVVDGDTLRLADGRSVRLIGVNAPELGQSGQPPEPFADAARKRLRRLVDESGGRVGLRLGVQAKDRYGRTLAHVYGADGANLEAQLLAVGLGYQVAIAPNVELLDCQQAAERRAREAHLGVWRRSPVLSPEQLTRSGFAVLSGRVSSVRRNSGGLWIEYGQALVLRIAPDQLAQFDPALFKQLEGQSLEVRGWVIDRARRGALKSGQARWMLPIAHPGMLKRLSR